MDAPEDPIVMRQDQTKGLTQDSAYRTCMDVQDEP